MKWFRNVFKFMNPLKNGNTILKKVEGNSLIDSLLMNRQNRKNVFEKKPMIKLFSNPWSEKYKEMYKDRINEIKVKNQNLSVERRNNHLIEITQLILSQKERFDNDELSLHKIGKKIRVAIFVSYLGTGYHGSNYIRRSDIKGIENEIERALFMAGHILPSNLGDTKRLKWKSTSRTDLGVHSLCTVLSTFILVDRNYDYRTKPFTDITEKINSYLPETIRVMDIAQTSLQFSCKKNCTGRGYSYLIPEKYLLLSNGKVDYNKLNEILQMYVGSNSFHNFTERAKSYTADDSDELEEDDNNEDDNNNFKINFNRDREIEMKHFKKNPINIRTISRFLIEDNVRTIDGERWLAFEVFGDSFIRFQIRKMIGFAIAIYHSYQPNLALQLALHSPFTIFSPISPPHSLYLSSCTFRDPKNNPIHLIQPDQLEPLKEQFKSSQLLKHINQTEDQSKLFEIFFNDLQTFNYNLKDIEEIDKLFIGYKSRNK